MKMYRGVEVKLYAFITSSLDGGERSALHTQRKSSQYPLYRKLGGQERRCGRGDEEKLICYLPLPGIEFWSSSP
jgi:hypothetical protein